MSALPPRRRLLLCRPRQRPWIEGLLALILGGIATLGFAPYGLWPLTLLSLTGLFALAAPQTVRRAAWLGWLFGFAHFASGVYWVYISTHVYGGASAWLGAALGLSLFAYLALYPALVLGAAAALQLWQRPAGWLGVPALWLLSELLRGWVYSGFPWLSLGYVALDTPLAKMAPLIGVHGLSALLLLPCYALFRSIGTRTWRRRLPTLLVAALPLCAALLPAPQTWSAALDRHFRVAIVQGNVPQEQKWDRGMTVEVLRRYRDMTYTALDADLIVWPEAVPNVPYDRLHGYFSELDQQARMQGATLIAGTLIQQDENTLFNSMIALGVAQGRYDKQHLVPFGEYFPIPGWLRPIMDVLGTPYSDLSAGSNERPHIEVRTHLLGLSICFEDVFGDELRRQLPEAAVLINATNDAWFGRSSAPHQHLQIARMRALETGRWLIRATNTGISAFIGPDGRVARRSDLFATTILRGEVPLRTGATPYVRWGDSPLWWFSFAVLGVLSATTLMRRKAASMPPV